MDTVKPKLPFAALIGIFGGGAMLLTGAYLEGSPLTAFFNVPACFIVLGGTMGTILTSTGLEGVMSIIPGYKMVATAGEPAWEDTAVDLIKANEIARREGMLKLQEEAGSTQDPFLAQLYQLLADGTDWHKIEDILISAMEKEHKKIKLPVEVFEKAGTFAPTMGIIGTVMGLVHALGLLSQPDLLGPAIAGAFMATLYGVCSANLFYLPVANRLKTIGHSRHAYRHMILEGASLIAGGSNSSELSEKLAAAVPGELSGDDLRAKAKG